MTKNKEQKTRFYCEKFAEMSTVCADRVIRFVAHEYSTSDPVEIKCLDALKDVERYDIAMEKKHLRLDGAAKDKLAADAKASIIAELKTNPKVLEELKAELKAELTEDMGKELEEEIKAEMFKNPPEDFVAKITKDVEAAMVKKPTKAVIDAVKKLG